MRIDLFLHASLWPPLLLILLSGDGRWVGATIGALLPGGRPGLRTMRLVMPAMACGPTQIAFAALVLHEALLPEDLVLALVAGAVLVEATTPWRGRIAGSIKVESEEWEMER